MLAARVFKAYHERGGIQTIILPDFIASDETSLVTHDFNRHRTSFPNIKLIKPST